MHKGIAMTEQQIPTPETDQPEAEPRTERFPEFADLEEKIQRRLRSNQRFLERFMDEDYDDLDDEDLDIGNDDEDPYSQEEL
jgi:hypothetical protein